MTRSSRCSVAQRRADAWRLAAAAALCATLSSFSGLSQAAPETGALADYAALEQALTQGDTVSVQLDLGHCTSKDGNHSGPAVRGGTHIDSYLIGPDRTIAFIDAHRTLDPQNHPVTEYVRYRVAPDQTVTVSAAYAQEAAQTATPRGEYRCAIGQGIRFIALPVR
jgi:hypothetical protein